MLPRLGQRAISSRQATLIASRRLASPSSSASSSTSASTPQPGFSPSPSSSPENPKTHYKITLTRSAIGLGARKKATLTSLGIHRRLQTVFHPHTPEFAGKILAVKELVRVENVSAEEVRSKEEMRRMRRPQKGFEVVERLGEGSFA